MWMRDDASERVGASGPAYTVTEIEEEDCEGGATIDEMAAATSWQPNSIRGALSGILKKKLGLDITSEKVEGRGRVYRAT